MKYGAESAAQFVEKLNALGKSIGTIQKHFDELLSQYDYVEEFIDDVVDAETGLGVEIKDYLMWFRDTSCLLYTSPSPRDS